MLKARYEDISLKVVFGGSKNSNPRACSVWWRDLCLLDNKNGEDAFTSTCFFRVGKGFIISFWFSKWIEGGTLKDRLPFHLNVSKLYEVSIALMGGWVNGVWTWNDFGSLHPIVHGTAADLEHLLCLFPANSPSGNGPDMVEWRLTTDRIFTVASFYDVLCKRFLPIGPSNRYDDAFSLI